MITRAVSQQDQCFKTWCDTEAAYEQFCGDNEQIDVLLMPAPEFEVWQVEYKRLYLDVWEAQLAYYRAARS